MDDSSPSYRAPIQSGLNRGNRYRRWKFDFKHSAPQRAIRRHVHIQDDFTCQFCGYRPDLPDDFADQYDGSLSVRGLTLDHIVPLFRGGARLCLTNLQTLCLFCNSRKGWH